MKNTFLLASLLLLTACGGGSEDSPSTGGGASSYIPVGASSSVAQQSSASSLDEEPAGSSSSQASTPVQTSSSSVTGGASSVSSSAPASSAPTQPVSSSSSAGISSTASSTAISSSSEGATASTSSSSITASSSSSLSSSSQSSSSSALSSSSSSSSLSSSAASSSSVASSAASSSSSSSGPLDAPEIINAESNSGSATLTWEAVSGADSYTIFYASEPYISSTNIGAYDDGDWEDDVTSPHTVSGLSNGTTWYFVVVASNGDTDSPDSIEVTATPLTSSQAANPTAEEVLMIELINRARFDPEEEASLYGIDLNQGLSPGTISPDQKPPLAHNRDLMEAARDHSQWMLNSRIFSHTGEGGSSPTQRMVAAGYSLTGGWTTGENISVRGTLASSINLNAQIPIQHRSLFESPGHRVNILNANFRDIGVGQIKGIFTFSDGIDYLSSMITQNFAFSESVSGVIYNDTNGNNFYDVGEGISGVSVRVGDASATTNSAGAYVVARGDGNYTVKIEDSDIPGTVNETLVVSGANKKFDVIVHGDSYTINTW